MCTNLALPEGSEDFTRILRHSKEVGGAVLMQREKLLSDYIASIRYHNPEELTMSFAERFDAGKNENSPLKRRHNKRTLKIEDVGGMFIVNAKLPNQLENKMEPRADGTCASMAGACTNLDMSTAYHPQTDGQSERTIQTLEDMLELNQGRTIEALYGESVVHLLLTEVGEAQILGPKLIQETTEKIIQIKQRMQATRDRQKSYADLKRNVGPSRCLEKVGEVAYKLELPEELSRVHNTFYVSNLKKYHADEPLAVLLDGLHLDDKLHFVEEPLENRGVEVKLKAKPDPIIQGSLELKKGPGSREL
ncbi:putative reverse transcriptase domain-containing protein [Tanacetum coccineum]